VFLTASSITEYLDLQWNELTSTISSKIGQLTDLKHFTVGKNRLTGPFPIESLQQLTKMEIFVVSANRLEGRIFDAVMSWPQLQDLQLSALPLVEGSIPTTIGQLSRLVSLFLEAFDPVVPTEIGLLTNLEIFHFSNPRPAIEGLDLNKTAILPTEIGKLTALSDLLFQSNSAIAGPIPTGKTIQLPMCTLTYSFDIVHLLTLLSVAYKSSAISPICSTCVYQITPLRVRYLALLASFPI
jgi:hypothetical protein